jgi:TolB-like protein
MFWMSWSLAATLAVLPLEQAGGEAGYEGLGRAFSGMLVADLSKVEGVELVERDRLDALLDEIELSEGGYLDPSTAQEAGRGLGAEFVVVGSYTVLEGVLVLDARVVTVQSGVVVDAARASGEVADFVGLEKQLVEDLADDLAYSLDPGTRRALYVRTPTESFDAFAAYGNGLHLQELGKTEDAGLAFERALLADPEFEEARLAMTALRTGLEERAADREADEQDAWTAQRLEVLARVEDERDRVSTFRHDALSLDAFDMRLRALQDLDRDCQRYDEMRAYLKREGLPNGQGPALFRNEVDFLFQHTGWVADAGIAKSKGLFGSVDRCFGPAEQVAELESVLKWAGRQDVAEQDGFALSDRILAHLLFTRVGHFGMDANTQRTLEALVDEHADDPARAKKVDAWVGNILRAAELQGVATRATLGLAPEVLQGMALAIANEDPAGVVLDSMWCTSAVQARQPQAAEMLEQGRTEHLWGIVAPVMDMGCLVGIEPRFTDPVDAYAWAASTGDRAVDDRELCETNFATLAKAFGTPPPRQGEEIRSMQTAGAIAAVYRLGYIPGCAAL